MNLHENDYLLIYFDFFFYLIMDQLLPEVSYFEIMSICLIFADYDVILAIFRTFWAAMM